MDYKESIIIFFLFISANCIGQTLIPYYESGKYGYCDEQGKVIIAPTYSQADFFSKDDLAIVTKKKNKVLINKQGYELASFLNDSDIQLLPAYHLNNENLLRHYHRLRLSDTIKHLRWVKINETDYQLLNLNTKSISEVYNIKVDKNEFALNSLPPQISQFVYGHHIAKLSEDNYDLLNTKGQVIISSESKPVIWNPEAISLKINGRLCLYNPATDQTYDYPYKSIVKVIDNKHLIVSTSEQNGWFNGRNRTKYGVVSIEGQVILDTVYQSIDFHKDKYLLRKNDNVYLSDLTNVLVDSTMYKYLTPLNDGLFSATRHDDKIKILDSNGRPALNDQTFDAFRFLKQENYYIYSQSGTASILDSTLKLEISYAAESIYRDYERTDRYIVSSKGLKGMINSKKELIVPMLYERCSHSYPNLITLVKDDKKGIADAKGKIILKPEYENIEIKVVGKDTLIRPRKDKFYACYNLEGEQLSGFLSRHSSVSSHPVDRYPDKGRYHMTDSYGAPLNLSSKTYYSGYTKKDSIHYVVLHKRDTINEVLLGGQLFSSWGKDYDSIVKVNLKYGLIAVTKGDNQAVIDVHGNVISSLSNQQIIEINNYFFISKKERKYFLVRHDGTSINEKGYDFIDDFSANKRRPVCNLIPNEYYEYVTSQCLTGRADTISKPQRACGYIDKYGEVLIPLEYSFTFRYFEEYVYLAKGFVDGEKECYLLDTLGKVVLQTSADKLYPLNHTDKSGYYIANKKGKHGLIDLAGNTIIPFEYSAIQGYFAEEIINVRDFNNDWHLLSIDNKQLFSGNHNNENHYEECYGIAKDKVLFFPNGESEVIDRYGKSYLKIASQDLKFITVDNIDLIEVNMGSHKYYINRETLFEYIKTSD